MVSHGIANPSYGLFRSARSNRVPSAIQHTWQARVVTSVGSANAPNMDKKQRQLSSC